jgi:hypothetical protein
MSKDFKATLLCNTQKLERGEDMNLKGWPFELFEYSIEPNGPPDDGSSGGGTPL